MGWQVEALEALRVAAAAVAGASAEWVVVALLIVVVSLFAERQSFGQNAASIEASYWSLRSTIVQSVRLTGMHVHARRRCAFRTGCLVQNATGQVAVAKHAGPGSRC